MMPIPIILLTGYLGAGKTTLLNHLLGLPEVADLRPTLVINEFGALGVDGKLVRPGDHEVFEINKGSLFCVCTKTQFLLTLANIAENVRPGLVIIEATGVAETRDIEAFLDEPSLAGRFDVLANLCVVDAEGFTKVAAFLKAAASQVAWADGILINKADRVAPAEVDALEKVLASMNDRASQRRVSFGRVPWEFIERLDHVRPDADAVDGAPAELSAASLELDGPVSSEAFGRAVAELGDKLLRLKGTVDFGDGPRFVEVVCGRLTEADPPAGATGTAFTAIGWQVSRETLSERFEACVTIR